METVSLYLFLIRNTFKRNIAANLAQMAHPGLGFFYPDDRVVVVSNLSFVSQLSFPQVNPLYHVYAMNTTTINLMVKPFF